MPKLYVVATPIGNLNDLTSRMREALESADLIAAEDTRVTMKLLNHWDIKKSMISCHRHNEDEKAPRIVERMLEEDLTVALTCDAGTPGISDPGLFLCQAAEQRAEHHAARQQHHQYDGDDAYQLLVSHRPSSVSARSASCSAAR